MDCCDLHALVGTQIDTLNNTLFPLMNLKKILLILLILGIVTSIIECKKKKKGKGKGKGKKGGKKCG